MGLKHISSLHLVSLCKSEKLLIFVGKVLDRVCMP